jgi:putative SOS response-associated peptidase YedK
MVVRRHPETGERHLDLLTWGLVPHWTKDLRAARRPINARAETVATSPMFRDAFARRRALIPAQAFYEWQRTENGSKQPYAIARRDSETLAFAGVWEGWRSPEGEVLRSFAIIVTAANATMAPIHDRMPVIVEPPDWPLWLGETEGEAASLLHPAAEDTLRVWPVSTRVNRPASDDADLLAPLPPA